MNYTENYEGIRLNVQAVDLVISDEVQRLIREIILRLRRHISEVNWVDVYFQQKDGKATNPRTVSMRFGIPGNDVFAEDSGYEFIPLIKNVEQKLRRQLKKR